MSKSVDRWPAAWKRPFYGPDVVARRLIAAGHALGGPMSSKTVEEAFEEWSEQRDPHNVSAWNILKSAFAAGVAHGATEALEIATSLPRIQVEGQWLIDLDEFEARIRQRGEK